ncbi:MAG: hypothetical protein FJY76_02125 [Candidatus Aenigmarchaeota archaeon]|nr:hypothetical protein [Candidatus Aenigmarchaeota archaeon]
MRHKFLLILPILLIVAMSGCVSDADKANLVIIDGNLTDYSLNYWSHFAKVSSEQLFQSKGQYMQFDYSTICPLHPYTGEASDTFDSMYYVSECDPAKIAELKTSDNGTFKEAYISLSEIKAVSAISKRINSTFYNIYSQNTVSNSDSVETVILDIANKTIDVTMMLPMISGMGDVWLFMTSGGVQGIQTGEMSKCWDSTTKEYSNTCLDTFFSKMESASPQIIQSTT